MDTLQALITPTEYANPNDTNVRINTKWMPQGTGFHGLYKRSTLHSPPKSYVVAVDSWLRRLGVYGSIVCTSHTNNTQTTRIFLGVKLPSLVSCKAISICARFARISSRPYEISILPGYIRVQNQVPVDSPFMDACSRGDVRLIRQYLSQSRSILNNRAICSGKTPLLVSTLRGTKM